MLLERGPARQTSPERASKEPVVVRFQPVADMANAGVISMKPDIDQMGSPRKKKALNQG